MLGIVAATRSHLGVVGLAFQDEALGVVAVLDVGQAFLHRGLGLVVDDLRTGHVFAVFRVVGDRVVHVGDAAFVHQVDDQLQFVQALEVGHFRRITGFGQRFETGLDQFHGAAAQHGLLAEQVGFGFFPEGGFDHAGTAAAIGRSVGQGQIMGLAGRVLVHRDQVGNAAALEVLGAHGVARGLGGDHDDVEVGARHDLVVVDVEAVGKGQGRALLQVRLDFITVQLELELIRDQDHHHIGAVDCLGHVLDLEASVLGLLARGRSRTQADRHLDTGILQVVGVGMALRTVADDGDLALLDEGKIGVLVVINFHG